MTNLEIKVGQKWRTVAGTTVEIGEAVMGNDGLYRFVIKHPRYTVDSNGRFTKGLPSGRDLETLIEDEPQEPTAVKPTNAATEQQVGGDYYRTMTIQPVQFIHANGIGYFEGNAIAYLSRWKLKNGVQDLRKAIHFIELLIELEEKRAVQG